MNSWILCFQTPYDTVKYMSNELNSPMILGYYKFVDYIQTLFIHNYGDFMEELNKFQTILIDTETHTWEIYEEKKNTDVSREELLKLNEKDIKEETKVERFKKSIMKVYRNKYDK